MSASTEEQGSARGLIIAAPRSRSGKTIITTGLMRACCNRGLSVAGAKCGPDYIDGAFHAAATGRPSLNLDSWAMDPALLQALAATAARGCDLLLCEGVMGLFDGAPAEEGRTGSTADVAAALGLPVLLVLDVRAQSQTAAAIVKGCASYDPRVELAGVILNCVASERHARLVAEAVEKLGIPVLGALPRDETLSFPERHLGLVQAMENEKLDNLLDAIAAAIDRHIHVDSIAAAAGTLALEPGPGLIALPPPARRMAVARDEAFSFLYPHLLSGWRKAGAEIVFFSPLSGEPPPEACDLCWLPGGYPELHAGRIAAASGFLEGLRRFSQTRPVHGECGGYMVLGQALTDGEGRVHRMAGLLDASFSFAKRKLSLGYRQARLASDHALGPKGILLRGHEFHYAAVDDANCGAPFAFISDARGGAGKAEGSRRGNVTGTFFHVIAGSR